MTARNPQLKTAYLDLASVVENALSTCQWKPTPQMLPVILATRAFHDFGRELQLDNAKRKSN
jgi:hypothetical protein